MSNSSRQLRQSIKGASIRKAGFLTGIHALPPKVKNRLDEFIKLFLSDGLNSEYAYLFGLKNV